MDALGLALEALGLATGFFVIVFKVDLVEGAATLVAAARRGRTEAATAGAAADLRGGIMARKQALRDS